MKQACQKVTGFKQLREPSVKEATDAENTAQQYKRGIKIHQLREPSAKEATDGENTSQQLKSGIKIHQLREPSAKEATDGESAAQQLITLNPKPISPCERSDDPPSRGTHARRRRA